MTSTDPAPSIGPEVYSDWRATSLGAITEAIEQHLIFELLGRLDGVRLLDVGCGDGALACAAAAVGAEVTGVDPDATMVAAARARAQKMRIRATFLEGGVQQLPFPDDNFDVVSSITVLCFVADAGSAIRELRRVLRPGGRLVLGELGRWSLWAAVRRLRGWFGSPTWRAAHFRSAGELGALAARAGLSVRTMQSAIYYPPLTLAARMLAPFDRWFARVTSIGAAFIAVQAIKDEPLTVKKTE